MCSDKGKDVPLQAKQIQRGDDRGVALPTLDPGTRRGGWAALAQTTGPGTYFAEV